MAYPLDFGKSNPFSAYDAAPNLNALDLSGFDRADGKTTVPAGEYVLRVDAGELTTTRAGKPAYRLRFVVVEPAEHAGFVLWRWFTLDTAAACNRAAAALRPLGLRTSDDLRRPFPVPGVPVYVLAVVGLKPARDGYPESNEVVKFTPCDPPTGAVTPPNPFAVPLTQEEGAK